MNRAGKRVGLIIAIFAIVLLLISLSARSKREPVVRGVAISEWMDIEKKDSEEYQAAVAEMDERCVRWLIDELEWSPMSLQTKLEGFLFRILRQPVAPEGRPDNRAAAAFTLSELGSRAQPAIPALQRNASTPGKGWRGEEAQSAAIAALILLRVESLDSWADKLLSPTSNNWRPYAGAAGILRTNAASIVPRLVNVFETTTDDGIKGRITMSLRLIRSSPALSLPVFIASLTNENSQTRFHGVVGLLNFGAESRSAWNDLVPLLSDSDKFVRRAATNALRQIDHDAAQRLDLKED